MICLGIGLFFFFPFILFVVLRASWICSLVSDINLGEITSHYCFKYFFYSFLSSSGVLIKCMSHIFKLSHSPWILSSVIFSLCSLCFSVLEVSTQMPLSSKILSSAVSSLLVNPTNAFFCYSVFVFVFISSISFSFFLRISISQLMLPVCSCILSILPIRALSVIIIIVLNSWSDNSNILTMSAFGACSVSSIVFFAFWCVS